MSCKSVCHLALFFMKIARFNIKNVTNNCLVFLVQTSHLIVHIFRVDK